MRQVSDHTISSHPLPVVPRKQCIKAHPGEAGDLVLLLSPPSVRRVRGQCPAVAFCAGWAGARK
ncbi:hypothetical protein AAFF_G00374140 [Aldrovandia affinis]|uniref:Uncharacterized protein n=1 Tax=Aldrovandia affinis TaxID=143900 RepID=A0AAD7R4D6_9TELE|nr:hypothetical protein AAFF_G00374140 [Aldrovandia affinis]